MHGTRDRLLRRARRPRLAAVRAALTRRVICFPKRSTIPALAFGLHRLAFHSPALAFGMHRLAFHSPALAFGLHRLAFHSPLLLAQPETIHILFNVHRLKLDIPVGFKAPYFNHVGGQLFRSETLPVIEDPDVRVFCFDTEGALGMQELNPKNHPDFINKDINFTCFPDHTVLLFTDSQLEREGGRLRMLLKYVSDNLHFLKPPAVVEESAYFEEDPAKAQQPRKELASRAAAARNAENASRDSPNGKKRRV